MNMWPNKLLNTIIANYTGRFKQENKIFNK